MSMLLDAVRRARQAESQDPALTPVMPSRRPRRRPWHWGLPVLNLAIGAAVGYLTLPGATESPVAVAEPSLLVLAEHQPLPVPTPLEAARPEPQLEVQTIAVPGVATPIEVAMAPEATDSTQTIVPDAADPLPEEMQANPALMAALQQALMDMGADGELANLNQSEVAAPSQPEPEVAQPVEVKSEDLPKLGQMPWAFQKRIPDVEITAHVYATDPNSRWLRANGRELQEGDEAAPGLTVAEILPSEVVLEMDGQRFRVPALGSL